MTTVAEVRHASRGRLRLHLAGAGADALLAATARLRECALVDAASTSAVTRTILVHHRGDTADVLAHATREGIVTLAVVEATPPAVEAVSLDAVSGQRPSQRSAAAIARTWSRLDARILAASDGRLDLPLVGFGALLVAALWQARRGSLLPAAFALVLTAFRMLGDNAERAAK